ncbi:MAG TPA: hypothetical protein VKF39_03070 [Nitrososphaerales archaeon]|nr:hypothetical protein [Nitrososphaerales archaeon]
MQTGFSGIRHATWVVGVLLGFAGAVLDFYAGYLILAQSNMINDMGIFTGYTSTGLAWGIGVVSLGVVLAVTSLASMLPSRMNRMGDFGVLMIVYGFAMLFIGGSMYLGLTAMMTGAVFPASAMLALGILMIANGALMRFSPSP